MSTFGELVDQLVEEIDNKHEKHEEFLRRAIVRSLKVLNSERVLFMERSTTFSIVKDRTEYVAGTNYTDPDDSNSILTGLPAAIREIVLITADDTADPCVKAHLDKVRTYERWPFFPYSTYSVPFFYAWLADTMWIAPMPAQNRLMRLDYVLSADRSESDGSVITYDGSSDAATNRWFTEGEPALRARVLKDYYLSMAKDAEAAAMLREEWRETIKAMRDEYALQNLHGQADFRM